MAIKRISLDELQPAIEAGATILVPNNRLRDAVLHAYGESAGQTVYPTPIVLGIDVWVRDMWSRLANLDCDKRFLLRPLSTTEETILWTEIIETTLDRYPLLNPEETANMASHAYQTMKHWQLDIHHEQTLQAYAVIPDIAAFLNWRQRFRSVCEQRRLISLADCLEQLNDFLASNSESPLAPSYVLLNFYQPPPLYAALFETLTQLTEVTPVNRFEHGGAPSGVHYEFPRQSAEFLQCANWARKLAAEQPDAHIGIVGEMDDSQRSALQHTLAFALNPNHGIDLVSTQDDFNSSHNSLSLIEEGIVHDAFLILGLLHEQQQSEDFCRLLRSPFIRAYEDERQQRNQLERFLRQFAAERCLLNELKRVASREDAAYCCPELATSLLNLSERGRRMTTYNKPRNWAALFSGMLADFGWPGPRLTPQQQQVVRQWWEVQQEFAQLSPVVGEVSYSKALSCLRSMCSRTRQPQQFDARRQISLYSLEEAVGLEFDHLWLVNFNDQVWPQAIKPAPFLPYSLQRELQIPGSHSTVQHNNCSRTFSLLCNAVSGSITSSHHCSDGEQEYRASSFASAFQHQVFDQEESNNDCRAVLYGEAQSQRVLIASIEDDEQVALLEAESSVGGHQALSDQSSCPFRAFALHRLQADPLQEFESGLSKMARGSAMHRAVDHLMQNIDSSTQLRTLTQAQLKHACAEAAQQAISYLGQRYPAIMTPGFETIERKRTEEILLRFLLDTDAEAGRGQFSVLGREQKWQWQTEGMTFNLVIDRIDEMDDGSLALIDYKTGKSAPSSSSWLAERPEDLQIPFYHTVVSESQQAPVQAVAIAHLNAAKIAYSGLPAADNFHQKLKPAEQDPYIRTSWQDLSSHFATQVKVFAGEFRQGIARVDPANGTVTCNYCQLGSLCRIDELSETINRTDPGED